MGKIPWRREWQPTPVFLPAESHGQRSLADLQSTTRRSHCHFHSASLRHLCPLSRPSSFTLGWPLLPHLLQHPGFPGPHLSPPYSLPPAGRSPPPPGRPPPSWSSSRPLMPSLIRPTTSRLCRCQAALGCASEGLCPRCLPLDRAGILLGPSPLRQWPPPRGPPSAPSLPPPGC